MGIWLERLALTARRRYRAVFLVFALLTILSSVRLWTLSFETDVLALLPRDEPVVREFLDTMARFGNIDYLLIAVRVPEGEVVAPYETFADRLAARLEARPEIGSLEYRIQDVESLFATFASKAVLFLGPSQRRELEERLSDAAIRQRVREMRRLLGTPQGMVLRDLLVLDPFGLAEVFLGRTQGSRGELSIDWQSGYYLSRDHSLLLILAEPTEPPQNLEFDQRLVSVVETAAAEVRDEWPQIVGFEEPPETAPGESPSDVEGADDDEGYLDLEAEGFGGDDARTEVSLDDAPPPPEVAMGGAYLTSVDEERFIRRDVILNILTSIVLVLSLFLLAFRRLGPLLYAIVPLAAGLILTFGFASLTLDRLSTATSGTAALLIGLGIDFVVVSYGRFVEERHRGGDLDRAIAAMARQSGPAVVVGAVTTAATFYAFLVTDFPGLWEMGFLTGTGILFCMISVMLLLPALLAWHERRHIGRETEPSFYLHNFGTDRIIRFALEHSRAVLVAGAVVTVVCAAFAFRLRFENDMMKMRPQGNRGIEVAQEIARKFGSGFNYMMLVVRGDTAAEVLERTDTAADRAKKLVDEGLLYRIDSVASLIPPPARQQEVLKWLAGERADALSIDRIETTFRRNLVEEGMRYAPFRPGLDLLGEALAPDEPLGIEDYATSVDTRRLLDRYVQQTGDGWVSLIYLFPPENKFRRAPPEEVLELARELGPAVSLTGNNRINQFVRVEIKQDAWIAGILGFVLVAILIWLDFGRLRDTLGALTPLTIGIVWMLGIMGAAGIDLNFMNIFVTTMIIGIGVDYGLHILHRYREVDTAPPEELRRGLFETGKAIMIAALSTICGFGSMSISHYPGLRTTGYVAILGALTTALVAITLLPAWFAERRAWKARRSG
jgi:predicted RND superfamily exporter protein